ncbi:BMP family protein [Romeria aff. gracilis LEGE 07310]|uniref:BMP family protein n=2 Tax=Vasconcelosia TaxID=3366328 RepID=A0A8J7DMJ5_9CYAN|nr:BMP family protein [Romeria aff. gracilis LEGE 07310]
MATLSLGSAALSVLGGQKAGSAKSLKVGMLIPGQIDDGGFMEAGYQGLLKIEQELDAETLYIDQIAPEMDPLTNALRELSAAEPDLIFAHGGQNAQAVEQVAPEYPDQTFVIVQGNITGPNFTSYEVLQEQSAWLAGAAAGLLTQTQTVGHISGIRVRPGLKGRAAFADGLRHTNPEAEFLTIFCGDQDDAELAKAVALAEIEAGADIIFTMLNAGRVGAIEACQETGTYQIGNVRDWYPVAPEVFIASAIADVSLASFLATQDYLSGSFDLSTQHKIGLEVPEAVRLAMAPTVPLFVQAAVRGLSAKIVSGEIEVADEYDGEEFELEGLV